MCDGSAGLPVGVAPSEVGARREWLSETFDGLSDGERGTLTLARTTLPAESVDLLRQLRSFGAEVVVVADTFGDGLGDVAAACDALGVSFFMNRFDPESLELSFPYTEYCCPCLSCGVCKQWLVRGGAAAAGAGGAGSEAVVVVTSSLSDRKAVLLAGRRVFGGEIRAWAVANGVRHVGFADFEEMCSLVLGIVQAR